MKLQESGGRMADFFLVRLLGLHCREDDTGNQGVQ